MPIDPKASYEVRFSVPRYLIRNKLKYVKYIAKKLKLHYGRLNEEYVFSFVTTFENREYAEEKKKTFYHKLVGRGVNPLRFRWEIIDNDMLLENLLDQMDAIAKIEREKIKVDDWQVEYITLKDLKILKKGRSTLRRFERQKRKCEATTGPYSIESAMPKIRLFIEDLRCGKNFGRIVGVRLFENKYVTRVYFGNLIDSRFGNYKLKLDTLIKDSFVPAKNLERLLHPNITSPQNSTC